MLKDLKKNMNKELKEIRKNDINKELVIIKRNQTNCGAKKYNI